MHLSLSTVVDIPDILHMRSYPWKIVFKFMKDFQVVRERWKKGGKMAYWLFKKSEKSSGNVSIGKGARFDKKIVLRDGKRNNFCILL